MRCLIDGDILAYELGYGAEFTNEEGEEVILPPDVVIENVNQRIREIEEECWADEPSTIYLTYSTWVGQWLDKRSRRAGLPPPTLSTNFRAIMETTKPYKGTRKPDKPFHFYNIMAHLLSLNCVVSDGCEADDEMAIEQTKSEPLTTVICSRDKDLRMVRGLSFGWQCGKQPQFGPVEVDEVGGIENVGKKGIKGTGLAFFYSQLLTGDAVDNIPGLPKCGPVAAMKLLGELTTKEDMEAAIITAYKEKVGDGWEEYLLEQGRLLWMITERDKAGNLVHWETPDGP